MVAVFEAVRRLCQCRRAALKGLASATADGELRVDKWHVWGLHVCVNLSACMCVCVYAVVFVCE